MAGQAADPGAILGEGESPPQGSSPPPISTLPPSSPLLLLIFPPAAASILLQSQSFCRTQPGTHYSCLFYQQPINKTRGLPSGYLECHPAGSSKKCNMGDQNILGETQKNEALTEDNRQWVGFGLPEPGDSSMFLLFSHPVMSDSL